MDGYDTTEVAIMGGAILCTYVAALAVWLFNRGGTSDLNWRTDLKDVWRPVKHILVQERGWLFGGIALTVVQALMGIHEIHGKSFCEQANYVGPLIGIVASYCTIRISWAIIRMMVVLRTPEKLHEFAGFGASVFRLMFVDFFAAIPTIIGWTILFVPGILCALLFSCAESACLTRNIGIMQSLRESGDLVSKNFRTVASYLLPASLTLWVLPSLAMPCEILLEDWQRVTAMDPLCVSFFVGGYVAFFLMNILSSAFIAALAANLYLHLRGKEEASSPVVAE